MPIYDSLKQSLADLQSQSLFRQRRVIDSPCGPEIEIGGRRLLAFASNDYLGLAGKPALASAAQKAARRWGAGAGASHLVSGHYAAHDALEKRLAEFVGLPAAISFSTGYMANIAVMPALLSRNDAIFADRVNHASLVDGALLARAELHRYPHGDLKALEGALIASGTRRKLIVSDTVFSMDGDIAPLAGLLELAERFDAWLLLDDAHGFGVLGPQGRGALVEAGLQSERIIYMGTLGKAAGVAGAFVAGSQELIDWLVNTARAYIFTTAAPPMLAETLLAAVDLIENADAQRAHLQKLIATFRKGMQGTRWTLPDSHTPIQPVIVGDNAETLALARALDDAGFWVPAIRPPTVPAGSARLRVSLTAAHTLKQVQALTATLQTLSAAA
ncbi:MAG: 8-amino-7-oxononanoate synthase [Moraxellaceae bacterium]|nr:8-amino-7-oxononanoate synthase [Moraxellaceae bacterium]